MVIITILTVICGVVASYATTQAKIEQIDQKVNMNQEQNNYKIDTINNNIAEIKVGQKDMQSDIKTILQKVG